MITYKDCSGCGARRIHSTVRVCDVCETWERAEQALDAQDEVLTARYNEQLSRAEKAERERDEARAEVERLRGVTPQIPPFPPDGYDVPRYGLRWNGPTEPITVPMEDGYWTPWHLADIAIAKVERERDMVRDERDEARTEAEWAKERLVEAREECDRQRALVARLAEAAGLADVWDPDALVQGVERMRKAMKDNDVVCQSMSHAKENQ